jgi:serine phosphatase RsbU (regulator of sigma subunit)
VEKTQIETEVKIAQGIQSHLVPLIELQEDSFNVFGKMKPAYQIGGDFFDLVRLSENKFIIAIGDVSGHNIAAGLLMAIAKSSFRTALQHTSSLTALVESMNRTIIDNSDKKMFVTFKCGIFDFTRNLMTVVNAGHLPMIHYQNKTGRVLEYNQEGIALGLSNEAVYTHQEVSFDKGDLFILVTDGIAEARNPAGDEFSFEKMKELIESFAADNELNILYDKLMSELYDFTDMQSFDDDITFLSVKIR